MFILFIFVLQLVNLALKVRWLPTRTLLFILVPTARLELAQLSPLPPQGSVSTNSTTTAVFCLKCMRSLQFIAISDSLRVYPEIPLILDTGALVFWISAATYLPGI